jgi:hypothetical protein
MTAAKQRIVLHPGSEWIRVDLPKPPIVQSSDCAISTTPENPALHNLTQR